MDSAIRIGIVDDSDAVRLNLKRHLEEFSSVKVEWSVSNGSAAIDLICKGSIPQVLLMDVSMPELSGIEATSEIRKICSEVKILILSVYDDSTTFLEAIKAGAYGYLIKGEKPSRIVQLIRDAVEDRFPLSPEMTIHA